MVDGRRIGILRLAQQERRALHLLLRLPVVEVGHVLTLLHQLVILLAHLASQDIHRRKTFLQALRDAVEWAFFVDDGLDSPHLLSQCLLPFQVGTLRVKLYLRHPPVYDGRALLARLLNAVNKLVGLGYLCLDKILGVARALGNDMVDGIQFLLGHLLLLPTVELLQFSAPLLPLHLVVQRAVPDLRLRQPLVGTSFLYARLALRVVRIQLVQVSIHLVPELFVCPTLFLRIHPVARVRQVSGMQLILNLQALVIIPFYYSTHIRSHAFLDGSGQSLILGEHGLHVAVRLDSVHEVLHLLSTVDQLLSRHILPVRR